jgi:hypothetical protein
MKGVVLLAAIAVLFAAGPMARPAAAQPAPSTPDVEAAWVQWTAGGLQVRVVTPKQACPAATMDGRALAMSVRAGPTPDFPQTVCQLDVPAGARRATVDGRPVLLPAGPPRRILIFGDTGCRLKGSAIQDCNDPRAWPFAHIAKLAAAQTPDLVIHVGDYYYRETPCPTDYAGCAGSPYGDRWATWKAEFFTPAAPLLAAAPWVFVRGNHESCVRGGAGWFRLLDAAARPPACPAPSAPFRADVGGLSLYVLDGADADDRTPTPATVAAYAAQIDQLAPGKGAPAGWILTHRPIWAIAPVAKLGPLGPLGVELNKTEQAAADGRDLSAIQMVVSGHIHHFAAYTFGPSRPAQLVAGTGGDVGDKGDSASVTLRTEHIDGLDAASASFLRFGYLLMDRSGEDWVGVFHDLDDKVVAKCRLHARRITCAAAG